MGQAGGEHGGWEVGAWVSATHINGTTAWGLWQHSRDVLRISGIRSRMLGAVQSGFGAGSRAVLPACVLPLCIQSAVGIVMVEHLVTTLA